MSRFITFPLSAWREWLLDGLSALVMFFSGTAAVGYIIGSDAMVGWLAPHDSKVLVPGMAFQTSVCLFALSIVQLFRPRHEH